MLDLVREMKMVLSQYKKDYKDDDEMVPSREEVEEKRVAARTAAPVAPTIYLHQRHQPVEDQEAEEAKADPRSYEAAFPDFREAPTFGSRR
jgi:hypothetical protein